MRCPATGWRRSRTSPSARRTRWPHGLAELGHPALGQALRLASTNAFLHGLTVGVLVAGGVAAAGAILTALFLPAQPLTADEPAPSAGQASLDPVM